MGQTPLPEVSDTSDLVCAQQNMIPESLQKSLLLEDVKTELPKGLGFHVKQGETYDNKLFQSGWGNLQSDQLCLPAQ